MIFILNIIITVATHVLLPSTCLLTAAVHIVSPGYGYIVFPFWGGGLSIKYIIAGTKEGRLKKCRTDGSLAHYR